MKIHTFICDNCNKEYSITRDTLIKRRKTNNKNLCRDCMKIYSYNIIKEKNRHKTKEEQNIINDRAKKSRKETRNIKQNEYKEKSNKNIIEVLNNNSIDINKIPEEFYNLSPKEKLKFRIPLKCDKCNNDFTLSYKEIAYPRTTDRLCEDCQNIKKSNSKKEKWKNMSLEDIENNKEYSRKYHRNLSNEERIERNKKISITTKIGMANRSEEKKQLHRKKEKDIWENKSEEDKNRRIKTMLEGLKKYNENLTPEEKEANSKKHSEIQIEIWKNRTFEEINDIGRNISISNKKYFKLLPDEVKEERNKKQSDRYNNLSDEDKRIHRQRSIDAWNKLPYYEQNIIKDIGIENSEEFWNNISNEKYNEICKKHQDWWDNLTKEEYEYMSLIHHYYWDNLSPEEYEERCRKCREIWNKITPEEYKERSRKKVEAWKRKPLEEKEGHRKRSKERWNNLSQEQFEDWSNRKNIGLQNYYNTLGIIPNKNESAFINDLNKYNIEYKYQYQNNKIHPDFYNLFPYNPVTSGNVEWQHWWDFIIYTNLGNILVDVDGSIHITDYQRKRYDGFIYSNLAYNKFNDSQRPYQTDNLDAYIIECYNDKLEDDTRVLELKYNKYISYKEFINMISLYNIITNEDIKI